MNKINKYYELNFPILFMIWFCTFKTCIHFQFCANVRRNNSETSRIFLDLICWTFDKFLGISIDLCKPKSWVSLKLKVFIGRSIRQGGVREKFFGARTCCASPQKRRSCPKRPLKTKKYRESINQLNHDN